MTVISVEAYEIKRDVVFSNADPAFHRASRPREFFLDQSFVDKTVGPQTSAVIPMRDRTVSQRALRDVPSKDRVIYSSDFSIFRHQPPIKQNAFTVTSFRDKPLIKETMTKSRKIRGEWASFTDNPFEGQPLTPEEIFEGQASTYGSQVQFKEQLLATGTPLKNLFRGQLSSAEPASFERQTFAESPFVSSSIKLHRDVKPIDSYEQYKNIMTPLDGKSIKYGELHHVAWCYTILGTYRNFLHHTQRINFSLIMDAVQFLFFFYRLSNLTCANCFVDNLISSFLLKHEAVC